MEKTSMDVKVRLDPTYQENRRKNFEAQIKNARQNNKTMVITIARPDRIVKEVAEKMGLRIFDGSSTPSDPICFTVQHWIRILFYVPIPIVLIFKTPFHFKCVHDAKQLITVLEIVKRCIGNQNTSKNAQHPTEIIVQYSLFLKE